MVEWWSRQRVRHAPEQLVNWVLQLSIRAAGCRHWLKIGELHPLQHFHFQLVFLHAASKHAVSWASHKLVQFSEAIQNCHEEESQLAPLQYYRLPNKSSAFALATSFDAPAYKHVLPDRLAGVRQRWPTITGPKSRRKIRLTDPSVHAGLLSRDEGGDAEEEVGPRYFIWAGWGQP